MILGRGITMNDKKNVEEKLVLIVNAVKNIGLSIEQLDKDIELFGISSIEFIKIIVECEIFWNIEFDPEKLNSSSFKNFNEIVQYIMEQLIL